MATELTVQSERAFQKQPHSEFSPETAASGATGLEPLHRLQQAIGDEQTLTCATHEVFLNAKKPIKSARPGKGGRRWYKDVGLGFRTPIAAITGQFIGT